MHNYILSYKEYQLKENEFVHSQEQERVSRILRLLAGSLVMIGGLGGILSTLQGYLITIWEEETWRLKNDPNYVKQEPQSKLGKFFKKYKLQFLLAVGLGVTGFAAFGAYKLLNLPMGVPKNKHFASIWDLGDTTTESEAIEKIDLNETSLSDVDKKTHEMSPLIKKVNAKSLIDGFKRDTHIQSELAGIASASSKKSAMESALKLQDYIKSKLNDVDISTLEKIGQIYEG